MLGTGVGNWSERSRPAAGISLFKMDNMMAYINDEQRAWEATRYLLEEMSPDERVQFESQLEWDGALCDELILGVRLLAATRASFAVPAVPPVPVKSSISVPGRTAVFSALVALCLMLMAVVSEVRRGYSPSVLLQDAVALSDLLDGSEMIPVDREADVEGLIDDHVAMPENPDWLITALDLDEQDSDVDAAPEEDEGLF